MANGEGLTGGALKWKISPEGFSKAIAVVAKMNKSYGKMARDIAKNNKKLIETWKAMGKASGRMFQLFLGASPRLRAEMDLINIRANQMLRIFADELAPVFRIISNLLNDLRKWFNNLSPPLKKAIIFGVNLAVVVGLLTIAFFALQAAISPVTLALLAIALAGAALFLVWESNFLGIQDLTKSLFEDLEPIFEHIKEFIDTVMESINRLGPTIAPIVEIIGSTLGAVFGIIGPLITQFDSVIGSVFDSLGSMVNNIVLMVQGAFQIIEGVLTLDFDKVLKGFTNLLKGQVGLWLETILWFPKAILSMPDIFGESDLLQGFKDGGKALIDAFIGGMQEAIDAAADTVTEILSFVGEFFGGSLPERGPLTHIVTWGEELGMNFVAGISTGIDQAAETTITKSFNIETVEMILEGGESADSRDFLETLDTGLENVRTSRNW